MKKFLVFCLICIVTATLGLLTYKFVMLEESITVNETVFEVNIGEEVPLDIVRTNAKPTTTLECKSLNPSVVEWDNIHNCFVATALGGKATLIISSNLRGFTPILVSVTVGNGSDVSPFVIRSAEELAQIGKVEVIDGVEIIKRPLDKCYTLITDINLTTYSYMEGEGEGAQKIKEWQPIGSVDSPFEGQLRANGHTITGLKITKDWESAGLFAKLGDNAIITGIINFENAQIDSNCDYAGVLAGINNGKVTRVKVENSTVISSKQNASVGIVSGYQEGTLERTSVENCIAKAEQDNSNVGGLVGYLYTNNLRKALVDRSYCNGVDVSGSANVGGLVGFVKGGMIANCYSANYVSGDTTKGLVASENAMANIGGLAGQISYTGSSISAIIADSYSTCKIVTESERKGQLIGYSIDENREYEKVNVLCGCYYSENSDCFGIGLVAGIGKITTIQMEQESYADVYRLLEQENNQTKTFKSHKEYIGDGYEKQVYWNIGDVWVLKLNSYPTLNIEGPYYDIGIYNITPGNIITNASDLIAIKTNTAAGGLAGHYVIIPENGEFIDMTNVNEWIPIGTEQNPFTGTLTCPTNEDGEPLYYIKGLKGLKINSDEETKGLFGYIASEGKVTNIILQDCNLTNGRMLGAIAGVNYGVIQNCKVIATSETCVVSTNTTSSAKNEIYVGGIVGINHNIVSRCSVVGAEVAINSSVSNTKAYLGGIAGMNNGIIELCHVQSNADGKSVVKFDQKCIAGIGGVVGLNNSEVKSCYNTMKVTTDINNTNSFTGGLVGINEYNGKLIYSFSSADITGTNVGGIVGNTYGSVNECYSEKTLTGLYVGGLACRISNGIVKNCYSVAYLTGTLSSSSELYGIAYDIAIISENEKSARCENCFVACSFDFVNARICYYETTYNTRRDIQFPSLKPRDQGYLVNCIFDREIGNGANRSNFKVADGIFEFMDWNHKDWRTTDRIIEDYYSSNEWSFTWDCGMTTSECEGNASEGATRTGYDVFRTYGFNTEIWSFAGGYPTLKNVVTR